MANRRDSWQGMNWIRQEKRLAIYIRDEFRCAYCGMDLLNPEPGCRAELDHIVPVSEGGSNHQTNLITACNACNNRRRTTPIEIFAGEEQAQAILLQAAQPIDVKTAKLVIETRHPERAATNRRQALRQVGA